MPDHEAETLAEALATEIRMFADAHGSWVASDLARHLAAQVITPALERAEAAAKAWEQNYDGAFWRWSECDTERLALKEQLAVARIRLRILTGTPVEDTASDWLAAHDAAIRAEAWDEALREVQAQAGRYGAAVSRTFLARSCERAYDALRAAQPTKGES